MSAKSPDGTAVQGMGLSKLLDVTLVYKDLNNSCTFIYTSDQTTSSGYTLRGDHNSFCDVASDVAIKGIPTSML